MSKQRTTAAGSGKRRLDFDNISKPLLNKSFYLDLPGYNNTRQLEAELTGRGARVDKFFHRDVKYLITTRDDSAQSPAQSSGRGFKSPLESVSPADGSSKPAYPTRAAMMLAASREKSGSRKSLDVLSQAKAWNCKVITLDAILRELKRLRPIKNTEKSRGPGGRVHVLTPPYFKADDQSRGYRPLVHETKAWPRASGSTAPNGCPFDKTLVVQSSPQMTHPMVTRSKKPGYCECCTQRYEDLPMHLRSGRHLEYANNPDNFASLDKLISKGTDFNDFVVSLKNKRKSPVKSITPTRASRSATPRTTPTKRLQSPRGRKSPRFELTREGVALRPSPKKTITCPGFTSPKTGELKIIPTEISPQQRSEVTRTPRLSLEAVPETPVKGPLRSSPRRGLLNLENLMDRSTRHRRSRSKQASLVVSFQLNKLRRGKSTSPTNVRNLFDTSASEGSFRGFSPQTARRAMTNLTLLKTSRKRQFDEVSLDNVITPQSKRRKVAARKSPRTP